MKILLIKTGGTIGSSDKCGTININRSIDIESIYKEKYADDVEFTVSTPVTLLSENYKADKWQALAEGLQRENLENYHGVIITHGSDTLSYTAALLGMLFSYVEIPIVLVAADYPLEYERSNGLQNFKSAVDVIKSGKVKGVFAAYGDEKESTVYLSTRIIESDPYCDKFSAFGGEVFGYTKNDAFIINKSFVNPTEDEILTNRGIKLKKIPDFKNNILLIRPYPNMDYSAVNLSNVKAVLHYLYHSATACTAGDDTSSIKFIEKCNELNIPVYLASFKENNSEYATSREMEKLKINKMYNISTEAAYMKLCIAYNQTEYSADELINTNIFFENLNGR